MHEVLVRLTLKRNKSSLIVIISKNVAKKAVERNLFRRRVKAIFTSLPSPSKDKQYIVTARSGATALAFEELKKTILSQVKI